MHMTDDFLGGAPGNVAAEGDYRQTRAPVPEPDVRMLWVHFFNALAVRMARWVALGMSFALFGYTVWQPDWTRVAAASAFTLLVNVPLWWLKKER